MADSLVKQLLEAGVHYGHKASNWNPKMQPYIFGKKNRIHIIDIRETIKGLLLAKQFLTRVVAGGKDVLFVGTKRQARPAIEAICEEIEMPYVIERWLGGTLTNFRTIRSRLKRLDELDTLMASEEWENYSKKMASQLGRERRKIHRNLSGLRRMDKLPGALVVIDVHREFNALAEARKLGIPTVCLIDTDSDPDLADIPVPGNDDAMRAIEIILRQLGEAVTEGKTGRAQAAMERKAGAAAGEERPRKRSSRVRFRADEEGADAPAGEAAASDDAAAPLAEAASAAPVAPEATEVAEADVDAEAEQTAEKA
ncbi:MAG: 30S ribosomal protein S2 [Phycisphaera sp.]|nr:30S ribosomal protein S2 [Phycisphaera sp.]